MIEEVLRDQQEKRERRDQGWQERGTFVEILCAVIGFYANCLPRLSRRSSVENIYFLLVYYPVESVC